jgi:hypothetical protein
MTKDGFQRDGVELVAQNRPAELTNAIETLREHAVSQLDQLGTTWVTHINAFVPVQAVSRILYFNELYQKILEVPGVICEFGVQYGAGLAQLLNCRNIYEPHNIGRIIYGFDTFEGFAGTDIKDGNLANEGDYSVGKDYFDTLSEVLTVHESFQPRPFMKKFFLIKGDASVTIDKWLSDNPHAIVSMVLFDMDIYKPTKAVLEKILPRLTKGSLLVFDELNHPAFPGETRALDEVLKLPNVRLKKTRWQPYSSYIVWE